MQLLELKGFYDIHLTHGGTEFGKDIIAKMRTGATDIQYSFQLKAGDVNLGKFRDDVRPQLIEACINKLSHPNFDSSLPYQVVFVTSGSLLQPAAIAFQEFNRFVDKTLKSLPIETWERQKLTSDFLISGIEPFFELHRSPELVGRFFHFYSQITNNDSIDSFNIEEYTKHWLELDWNNSLNKLQVLFESYFFSKLLMDKGKQYEATLVLSALVRTLLKNESYNSYREAIEMYFDEISTTLLRVVESKSRDTEPLDLYGEGFFKIFYYPSSCLRTLEVFSLHILTSVKPLKEIESLFLRILKEEKGCCYVLSNNYAISVVLISLVLLKLGETERLRIFLNNVCVWLCDRHEDIGISPIGSSRQEEFEQLLSEYLTGLSFQKETSSFLACALLDMAYLLGDKSLFEHIANDLKAVGVALEFYHILSDDALYTYNHREIVTSFDPDFSIKFKNEYSRMIQHERKQNSISVRDRAILFLMFLLRDRYFPSFIKDFANQS
ncbi:MAG: hypothetical protein PHC68_05440 [Syntrophorhabdaceae bacterium]|nr:hypothetical protein [Syntrophorhabdaceae bacterium]